MQPLYGFFCIPAAWADGNGAQASNVLYYSLGDVAAGPRSSTVQTGFITGGIVGAVIVAVTISVVIVIFICTRCVKGMMNMSSRYEHLYTVA